ncbi:hypothetical protein [Pseudomonas putida]|uniref:hypothetical protein n=1 Tax=Pseudomonas putida TaxID=303 RepID=UPI0020C46311|nr:hypothetical protein [Pseudomonas putida]UTL82539.1 hypothetical protein NL778_06965 [Pseudomonas putida]
MTKHTLPCSLLTLLLFSFNHAANAQSGGTITLLDPNNNKCSFDIPGPGSGVTQQFNLTAHGSSMQCKDWKVRSLVLTDLPSAATIYMTDDPWCARGAGEHEITLRTVTNGTSTDPATPWEIANLYAFAAKSIITPGLQLSSKRQQQGADPKDSINCIEVSTSPGIDSPPLAATTLVDTAEHKVPDEKNSKFDCPEDTVIVKRKHAGDEREQTNYWCSRLKQKNTLVTLSDPSTSVLFSESGGHYFTCPPNQVMTGRDHRGDENGDTRYRCATPKIGDHALTVTPGPWSASQSESESSFDCQPGKVMIGRWHDGDENKSTRVRCATVQ